MACKTCYQTVLELQTTQKSTLNYTGGAYSAPPDPLAGEAGDWLPPSSRTPPPDSALRASSFGPHSPFRQSLWINSCLPQT